MTVSAIFIVAAAVVAVVAAASGTTWTQVTASRNSSAPHHGCFDGTANPFPRPLADYQCAYTTLQSDGSTYIYNMTQLTWDGSEQSPPSSIGTPDRDYVFTNDDGAQTFTLNVCELISEH